MEEAELADSSKAKAEGAALTGGDRGEGEGEEVEEKGDEEGEADEVRDEGCWWVLCCDSNHRWSGNESRKAASAAERSTGRG